MLERGEQGGIQAIPLTLQQSLTARLDRLGPAREVAQIGAVIGRGFSYALLRAVAGIEDTALQTPLERLADADILLVRGLPPESDYRFKHALIQDAGDENLLKSRRQVLHRHVAEELPDHLAGTAEDEPQIERRARGHRSVSDIARESDCRRFGVTLATRPIDNVAPANGQSRLQATRWKPGCASKKWPEALSFRPSHVHRRRERVRVDFIFGRFFWLRVVATSRRPNPASGARSSRVPETASLL